MRATAHRIVAALCIACFATAQSSSDVVLFFRSLATTLAEAHDADGLGHPDAGPFLEHFDSRMAGFADLRDEIEALVTRAEIGSSIEILTDDGDEHKRKLQLDWILEIQDQRPRRQLIQCTIEKDKNEWKITALEPVDFFKY